MPFSVSKRETHHKLAMLDDLLDFIFIPDGLETKYRVPERRQTHRETLYEEHPYQWFEGLIQPSHNCNARGLSTTHSDSWQVEQAIVARHPRQKRIIEHSSIDGIFEYSVPSQSDAYAYADTDTYASTLQTRRPESHQSIRHHGV